MGAARTGAPGRPQDNAVVAAIARIAGSPQDRLWTPTTLRLPAPGRGLFPSPLRMCCPSSVPFPAWPTSGAWRFQGRGGGAVGADGDAVRRLRRGWREGQGVGGQQVFEQDGRFAERELQAEAGAGADAEGEVGARVGGPAVRGGEAPGVEVLGVRPQLRIAVREVRADQDVGARLDGVAGEGVVLGGVAGQDPGGRVEPERLVDQSLDGLAAFAPNLRRRRRGPVRGPRGAGRGAGRARSGWWRWSRARRRAA